MQSQTNRLTPSRSGRGSWGALLWGYAAMHQQSNQRELSGHAGAGSSAGDLRQQTFDNLSRLAVDQALLASILFISQVLGFHAK